MAINFYTFDKSKHLELSDSILGHSQFFSDTILILAALGQAISLSQFSLVTYFSEGGMRENIFYIFRALMTAPVD